MPADPLDPEAHALFALQLIPGVGPRLTRALVERFGSAAAALRAPVEDLRQVPRLSDAAARLIAGTDHAAAVARERELLDRHGVRAVALGSDEYPSNLAALPDPPRFLYARGSLTAADRQAVAVVGSRHCTDYGRRMAERLAGDLARAGVTIVSGLAYGIDAVAHQAALAAGGRTLAVLAGGLSRIYPADHADLAQAVTGAGALITEAAMGQQPQARLFPARNRIVSGLSRGVVVVEAAERSGALITAEHARKQGRPVFAVPGPADSPASQGALELLRQGAVLVRDAADVLKGLALPGAAAPRSAAPAPPPAAAGPPPGLTPAQATIWAALAGKTLFGDDLVAVTGLTVGEVSQALVLLELRGAVRRLPGNRFERKG